MKKWGKLTLVVVGAVIVTALGIDATDTITGSRGTLLSQLISSENSACPVGMAVIENGVSMRCVDIFEASVGEDCPILDPGNTIQSNTNVGTGTCLPESKNDVMPWRFVTRDQAMQLCARAGKRLPTSREWYTLSLGMSDTESSCNVQSKSVLQSGSKTACVSPHGVFDLVGNLWEWVSDDVIDGKYEERTLPVDGYVAQVDQSGMATVVETSSQALFGGDYFWSQEAGSFGIIRGGYYDSGVDAGIYTVHADTAPSSGSAGIGFRCVK